MTIDYNVLDKTSRLLVKATLKPLQGHRFQTTGFADLGPALYTLPDGTEMLLVESAQSVANRMELACWDTAADDLIDELHGLPYVRVDCGSLGKTNTIQEFHRLNSPYIWSGQETEKAKRFRKTFLEEVGLSESVLKKKGKRKDSDSGDSDSVPGVLDFRKFYRAVFKFDPSAVIHGLFLEKVAGRLRMTRVLSGFIEASDVKRAESGGTKIDHVLPSPKALGLSADDGYGNVPFPRSTEFVGKLEAYFNVDLALLRGYGLGEDATKLLVALSLFKIRRFLSSGLRLRTACDLEVDGDLTVTRPAGFTFAAESELLAECQDLIGACAQAKLFADPAITDVEWKPREKPVEVKLPSGTDQPTIPTDLTDQLEWKKGTAKRPPSLKFKKALTADLASTAKTLFPNDEGVAAAIDEALKKQSEEANGENAPDDDTEAAER